MFTSDVLRNEGLIRLHDEFSMQIFDSRNFSTGFVHLGQEEEEDDDLLNSLTDNQWNIDGFLPTI